MEPSKIDNANAKETSSKTFWSFNQAKLLDGEQYILEVIGVNKYGKIIGTQCLAVRDESLKEWAFIKEHDAEGHAVNGLPFVAGTPVGVLCWMLIPELPAEVAGMISDAVTVLQPVCDEVAKKYKESIEHNGDLP